MEKEKNKKLNLLINIPVIVIFAILFFSPLFINNDTVIYYSGIACRVTTGLWCIFNGLWNLFTDYYSILKDNIFQKKKPAPKWAWGLLLIVGIGCLITAFMGYGFNNVKKPI